MLRHRPPIGIAEPRFREIQQRAGHPRTRAGPERGRHRDLAIRDLAQRATVLTRHADRMGALFGKTRAVDDQHAAALGQHLEQPSPDPVGVPGRVRNEMLKALVGDRVGDAGQHRLHRLPIAVAEEAVHVRPQREPLRAMAEAALKRFEPANQALNARGRRAIDHRAPAYRIQRFVQGPQPDHGNIPERTARSNKVVLAWKELQEAADAGWHAVGQTVFESLIGGKETAGILERNPDAPSTSRYDYKLIATSKTSTLEKTP